jgi:hypothetical protein
MAQIYGIVIQSTKFLGKFFLKNLFKHLNYLELVKLSRKKRGMTCYFLIFFFKSRVSLLTFNTKKCAKKLNQLSWRL